MICPECHAEVPSQYSFCPKCGLQVKGMQADVRAAVANEGQKTAAKQKSVMDSANKVLCGLLAVNLLGGIFTISGAVKKGKASGSSTAEVSSAADSSSEDDSSSKAETTKKTESSSKDDNTTATTAKTTEKKSEPAAQTTETEPAEPAKEYIDPNNAYYQQHNGATFKDNTVDAFWPPNMKTAASNHDGSAPNLQKAVNAMASLPVNWKSANEAFPPVPDNNGTYDTVHRWVTDAYPVPTLNQDLPAAVDLVIHTGITGHGDHLRRIDYYFGNHLLYNGGNIFTEADIHEKLTALFANASERFAGGIDAGDPDATECYRFFNNGNEPCLDIGMYYNPNNGGYYLRVSRYND